jgi:2-polyprenyl-6-methoxyphenol hydroxylase-like FAD-dependent oxidoreductase
LPRVAAPPKLQAGPFALIYDMLLLNNLMPETQHPITIIGGGLAGLTLGIGLRQKKIPVCVLEAGHYPRHRVCGEFISGRGQETLARLGLADKLSAAGAIPAHTTVFFSPRAKSAIRKMTEPAWSISRYALDAFLAAEFRALGGELHENERWRGNEFEPGMVRATGRRVQPTESGWRWFGLKVHARNVSLDADLEMHLSPSSYLGISRLNGGEVNICGLFRRPSSGVRRASLLPLLGGPRCAERTSLVGKLAGGGLGKPLGRGQGESNTLDAPGTPHLCGQPETKTPALPPEGGVPTAALPPKGGVPALSRAEQARSVSQLSKGSRLKAEVQTILGQPGSPRYERLANAVFDEQSFCSVAGLSLRPQRAAHSAECCIGDGITMIPPVTGNGMSMAFESAELAVEPLAAYSRGELDWRATRETIARLCDERFARRLKWAWKVQRLMFLGPLQGVVVRFIPRWEGLWRLLLERTR